MSGGSGSIATTENTSFDIKTNARLFEPGIFLLPFAKFTRPLAGEQPEAAS